MKKMPENSSKTSNQRNDVSFNTRRGNESNNLWVSSKGGLFKFDSKSKKLLFSIKNNFPKKVAAYPQILLFKIKVNFVIGDSELIQFRILDQSGNVEHESFIEGKVQSLAITKQGDLFMTKQMKSSEQEEHNKSGGMDESIIWRSHIDFPSAWDEFASSFDECFQCLCLLDDETLAVSVASLPVNIYSKQSIKLLNIKTGQLIGKPFSSCGKEKGQIFFPRCIRSCNKISKNNEKKEQTVLETVSEGLRKIYKEKLYPLEEYHNFHDYHSPALDDPDFNAKPMILLVGQYSTGKTTFIRFLLEQEFPGMPIGPETIQLFTLIHLY